MGKALWQFTKMMRLLEGRFKHRPFFYLQLQTLRTIHFIVPVLSVLSHLPICDIRPEFRVRFRVYDNYH